LSKAEGRRPKAERAKAAAMRGGGAPRALNQADTVRVAAVLDRAIRAHEEMRGRDLEPVARAAGAIRRALAEGQKVLAFGNGGSAADAQHFAAELVGRFERDRKGAAAVALTADTSAVTAIANDYGFERVFARQIEALGRRGDVALGITTSGRSPNVVAALEAARARGMVTIALTGRDGGAAAAAAAIHVNAAGDSAARIQEVQRTLLHAMCELIEQEL
jgi:D-sedoheptulose 7-phosphate isomerase